MSYKNGLGNNIIVLDCETGGLDAKNNGLCTVTLKKYGSDVMKTWYLKPNPELEYDDKALEINGLTLEYLNEHGVSEDKFIVEMQYFLYQNFNKKPMPLGQNLHFDLKFIENLFNRYEQNLYKLIDYHYLDAMILSGTLMMADKIDKQSVSLGAMHEYLFKENIENQHTSEADVIATEKVFNELLKYI